MARIFITGSADGLGLAAAKLLVAGGHDVVLHARNDRRAADARAALPGARDVIIGDLSSLATMRTVARDADRAGPFDAVIHNAAIGYQEPTRVETVDGLPQVLAVNSLAPYVLTALMKPAARLVYLSSGLHRSGDPTLRDLTWRARRWDGTQAYSDSKLHDALLGFAVARLRPGALSNVVHPGWVPTKMGGASAPDDLQLGAVTQAWLAAADDPRARVSGRYFFHQAEGPVHPAVQSVATQDAFLAACAELTGVVLA